VLAIWLTAALFGRDIVSLASVQHPREAFITNGELASTRATAHSVDICSE
jgi:NADH dehydrogenase